MIGHNFQFFDVTLFIDENLHVLNVANGRSGWWKTRHIFSYSESLKSLNMKF